MNIFKSMKQVKEKRVKQKPTPADLREAAYQIAEKDGFRRHPSEYWAEAEQQAYR